jgi:hypothetical protein
MGQKKDPTEIAGILVFLKTTLKIEGEIGKDVCSICLF